MRGAKFYGFFLIILNRSATIRIFTYWKFIGAARTKFNDLYVVIINEEVDWNRAAVAYAVAERKDFTAHKSNEANVIASTMLCRVLWKKFSDERNKLSR